MKDTSILKILISSLVLTTANAQEVTREEFEALLARVKVLEQKLSETHATDVETIATKVAAHTDATEEITSESTIVENVISVIHSRDDKVNHPWMDSAKWAKIEKSMSVEAVLEILGKPYTNEPSLRKRIDYVYTYQGRRAATNKKVVGIIRFYKDKVVNIESPDI